MGWPHQSSANSKRFRHESDPVDLEMKHARESRARISGLRVVQITALGTSAKMFLVEHFRKLREAGAEVILISSDDPEGRAAAEAGGIRHVPVTIRQTIAPVADILAVYRLWCLLRQLRPDVIHAHMAKAGLLGVTSGWLAGVPVRIYHNHGLAMLSAHGLKRQLLRTADWLTSRFATHSLFCSESTRDAGVTAGTVDPDKAWVLGSGTISGVDTDKFVPDTIGTLRAKQRTAWGISEATVVVGFVGRLVPHKGIETLIGAWRQLDPAVRGRACLVLAGGEAYSEPKMRAIVEEAARDGIGVKTVGWVDDMVSCYNALDLLVLPSWHEGLPYSILEAQSVGVPVIATRATGNVDAVEHEITGLLVPVKAPIALARALSRLICSEEDRRRFGEHGRQRIVDEFSQDEVLQNMLAFYNEMATGVKA